MKFTLTYDGELPAGGNSSRKAKEKWEIRNSFHPQIEELRLTHPSLNEALSNTKIPRKGGFVFMQTHHTNPESGFNFGSDVWDLCEPIDVLGRKYLPIVRHNLALVCHLKIIFLRKEAPGRVYQGGDLDNRIKVLFDALRMPTKDEPCINSGFSDPMYCLLEDDALLTGFDVRSDRLLTRPGSSQKEVRLIIEVDVRVSRSAVYNHAFLSD